MGFYSPEVIVGDARRHGVDILPVHINRSEDRCTVEAGKVRLGFRYVKEMGEAASEKLEEARKAKPFASLEDIYRRAGLSREAMENLILVGALDSFGLPKRQLLWRLGLLENQVREGPAPGAPRVPGPPPGPYPDRGGGPGLPGPGPFRSVSPYEGTEGAHLQGRNSAQLRSGRPPS